MHGCGRKETPRRHRQAYMPCSPLKGSGLEVGQALWAWPTIQTGLPAPLVLSLPTVPSRLSFSVSFNHGSRLLITGDTYLSRRDIKAIGGKSFPEQTGWIIPLKEAEGAEKLAAGKNFIVAIIEVEPEALETPTGERLRAIRQARLDRKYEQRNARADRLEKKAEEVMQSVQTYMNMEFLTEPIKIGHHSEKGHRRLREKITRRSTRNSSCFPRPRA